MAAGGFSPATSPGRELPLTEEWDGMSWTTLTTPHPAGAVQTYLNGLSCTSLSACTITGEQHSACGVVHTVAERWDGMNWTVQATPNPSGVHFASLWGVDCTGLSACLAAGTSDAGTLAERWDGSNWTIDTTPNPPGGGGQLFNIACPSPSVCTAAGYAFTGGGGVLLPERRSGTTWRIQRTPLIPAAHDMGLPAIACPTKSWCIAVSSYENDGGNSVTLAEQWRGRGASIPAAPRTGTTPARSGTVCTPPLIAASQTDMAALWKARCAA